MVTLTENVKHGLNRVWFFTNIFWKLYNSRLSTILLGWGLSNPNLRLICLPPPALYMTSIMSWSLYLRRTEHWHFDFAPIVGPMGVGGHVTARYNSRFRLLLLLFIYCYTKAAQFTCFVCVFVQHIQWYKTRKNVKRQSERVNQAAGTVYLAYKMFPYKVLNISLTDTKVTSKVRHILTLTTWYWLYTYSWLQVNEQRRYYTVKVFSKTKFYVDQLRVGLYNIGSTLQ